jgi:hypothetical protein
MGARVIRSIHPEHGYESEALEETVAEIEKSVSHISTSPTGGVDSYGDEAVSEVLGKMLAAQQESLESGPYFARVDYREDGEEPKRSISGATASMARTVESSAGRPTGAGSSTGTAARNRLSTHRAAKRSYGFCSNATSRSRTWSFETCSTR